MKKLIALACLIVLFSCQKKSEETTTTEAAPVTPSFENERKAFFNSLMTPGNVAGGLQATGAEFNASLLNDPKNFDAYTKDENKAAAN